MNPRALDWRRNADTYERALRRRAVGGDAEAAHALAQALLRHGRLTVNELATLGRPAGAVLTPELKQGVFRAILPLTVWTLTHSWEYPGRGSERASFVYVVEEEAFAEGARRIATIVIRSLEPWEAVEEDNQETLDDSRRALALLDEGKAREAWRLVRNDLDRLGDYDEDDNRVAIHRTEMG
jgi:hypothetical protein